MKLFKYNSDIISSVDKNNKITTPLGNILFKMSYSNFSSIFEDYNTYKLSNGFVNRWKNEDFILELFIKPYNPVLPKHMEIDSCYIAIWKVYVKKDLIDKIIFTFEWDKGYIWIEGGPNSGEHLDAQTFDNGSVFVTIGTHDSEMLYARALNNELIPLRLKKETDSELIKYYENRFEVLIPELNQGDECQIHFLIAWGESEIPTWYAADLTYDEIARDILNDT